jgi:hypothetical protein
MIKLWVCICSLENLYFFLNFHMSQFNHSKALSRGIYSTVPELEQASGHIYHLYNLTSYFSLIQSLKLCDLGRCSLQTSSLGDSELAPIPLTKNPTKSGDYSPRFIWIFTWPRSRNLGARGYEMSNCTIVKLNLAIAMNRRSMNEDRGWGITAEREDENSGCASSWPAIHPCCWYRWDGRSTILVRLESSDHFPYCRGRTLW